MSMYPYVVCIRMSPYVSVCRVYPYVVCIRIRIRIRIRMCMCMCIGCMYPYACVHVYI